MEYNIDELEPFIFGLPWFGKEDHELRRFPTSILPTLTTDMQRLVKHPAGAQIRFRARTELIAVDLIGTAEEPRTAFSRIGQYGIDVYCDGSFIGTLDTVPGEQDKWLRTDDSRVHEYCLYLPTYSPLVIKMLVVDATCPGVPEEGTQLEPPSPFAVNGKIVVYGSSITQGAYASRPGLAYPAKLGRSLNAEVVNLGFAGAGKGEPEVADCLVDIPDVALYILDWGCNLADPREVGYIRERYPAMLEKIKDAHPGVPILFISPQTFLSEFTDPNFRDSFKIIRDTIEDNYWREVDAGMNCEFIDGRDIVGPGDLDATVDGVHCNDLGFDRYVQTILPAAKRLLDI
ncbi:MAG TPA: SGNH/GDSL hydrolase family protein [Candidatus Lokiarchaeia archaeon]|nr:SGNH/GDSL hydrolase family protein [Candidatus Lokiarchaeia archaeon]